MEFWGFEFVGSRVCIIGSTNQNFHGFIDDRTGKYYVYDGEDIVGDKVARNWESAGNILFNLSIIQQITDKNGNVLDGAVLRDLTTGGRVPFPSVILIQNEAGANRVAMGNIYQFFTKACFLLYYP